MKTLEVRCCCAPKKLVGHLEVSDQEIQHGRALRYYFTKNIPSSAKLCDLGLPTTPAFEQVVLTIDRFQPESGQSYLAIKAEDVPIETLKRICGFKALP